MCDNKYIHGFRAIENVSSKLVSHSRFPLKRYHLPTVDHVYVSQIKHFTIKSMSLSLAECFELLGVRLEFVREREREIKVESQEFGYSNSSLLEIQMSKTFSHRNIKMAFSLICFRAFCMRT